MSSADMTIEGSIRHGYACNCPTCPEDDPNSECGGGPVTPTGACCFDDGTCSVTTQTICESSGGSYQGDGTPCDPNPCPQPTGACCSDDGICSITTFEDCTGAYLGDGTSCEPNPCGDCPHNDTICITFSGIEKCPCVDVGSFSIEFDGDTIGAIIELTKTVDTGDVVQWEGTGPFVRLNKYPEGICEVIEEQCDAISYVIIQCSTTPAGGFDNWHAIAWEIRGFENACFGGLPDLVLFRDFRDGVLGFDGSEDNQLSCIDFSSGTPIGNMGSAGIAAGGCG